MEVMLRKIREVEKMGLKEKSRTSKLGGKPTSIHAFEGLSGSCPQPVLAIALSLILFVAASLLIVPYAKAADPGHAASSISSGTFESGDFIFQSNLTVNKFFIANGTTLYVDAVNGRVGIGVTNPTTNLDVNGSLNITDANGRIRTPELCLAADSCRTTWPSGGGGGGWTNTSTLVSLSNAANNVSANTLFVDNSNGMVGIGTASPTAPLHIKGPYADLYLEGTSGENASFFYVNRNGAAWSILQWYDTDELLSIRGGDGGIAFLNAGSQEVARVSEGLYINGKLNVTSSSGAGSLLVQNTTGGSHLFVNGTTGRVGIGTATPSNRLEVAGDINASSGSLIFYNEIMPDGATCSDGQILKRTGTNNWDCAEDSGVGSESDPRWSGNYTACTSTQKLYFSGTSLACNADADTTCSSAACTVGSDDSLSNPTVTADISMSNSLLLNIGNAATDFTTGGGLTLNGNFSVLGTGTQTIAGNSNFDGNTLFVNASTHYVGIGTATPSEKLEVSGNVQATNLEAGNGSASAPSITFSDVGNTGFYNANGAAIGATAGGVQAFYFDNSFLYSGGADGNLELRFQNSAVGGPTYTFKGDADTGIYWPGASTIGFSIDGVERMRIGSTGNVGIGDMSPGYKLEVNGSLNVESTAGSSYFFVNQSDGYVGIGTTEPAAKLHLFLTSGNIEPKIETNNGHSMLVLDGSRTGSNNTIGILQFQNSGSSLASIQSWRSGDDLAGNLIFYTKSSTDGSQQERIRLTESGNVGIGTATPGKKLEVSNSTQSITFDPTVATPTINTTASTNLTITSSGGNVIIQLG